MARFLTYGRWIFVAVMIDSLTDVLDLDATTLTLLGVILACLTAARRLALQATEVTADNAVQHT
jgi:hypothetical protein